MIVQSKVLYQAELDSEIDKCVHMVATNGVAWVFQAMLINDRSGFMADSKSDCYTHAVEKSKSSLVLRPHPRGGKVGLVTFERFLGSCKLSILTFAKANQIAALRFSCDLASGRAATIVQCQLAV